MTYFSLFLVTAGIAVVDSGFQTVDKEIRELLEGKEEQTIQKEKEKLTNNRANIQTRRVTNVACKFSTCLINLNRSWLCIFSRTRPGTSDH